MPAIIPVEDNKAAEVENHPQDRLPSAGDLLGVSRIEANDLPSSNSLIIASTAFQALVECAQ